MCKATKIDIEEELKAKENGQCLACRIKGTHIRNKSCVATSVPGSCRIFCQECETVYFAENLSGKYKDNGCPDCFDRNK